MPARKRRPRMAPSPVPVPEIDKAAVDEIVLEVRGRFKRAGYVRLAEELRETYGSNLSCYGIKPVEVHNIGMDYVRRLRSRGYELTLAVSDELCSSGNLEEGLLGAQLVGALARHISGSDIERFERWADELTNEQSSEAIAYQCISRALAAKPSIALRLLEWTKSENRWKRVASVAAFSPLVRDGRFMTDALAVALPLTTDPAESVQRAVGTMLMEMTRLKADRVLEFLDPLHDTVPRLILQLAATKLVGADRTKVLG